MPLAIPKTYARRGVVALLFAAACGGADGLNVEPPSGWFSGNTHEHVQLCFGEPLRDPVELLAEMRRTNLNVSSILYWAPDPQSSLEERKANFRAMIRNEIAPGAEARAPTGPVTGAEDPASEEGFLLQTGVESSGFYESDLFGHVIGLDIGPEEADFLDRARCLPHCKKCGGERTDWEYPGPVFDHFRQDPEAVTGYAHVSWPEGLRHPAPPDLSQTPGGGLELTGLGFDWQAFLLPHGLARDVVCTTDAVLAFPRIHSWWYLSPPFLPIDVAFGRVDFLETCDTRPLAIGEGPAALEHTYRGALYKLLSAGQRVSLSGGTDANCLESPEDVRTWVLVEGELTYDAWVEGLRAGRTSIATGPSSFLELRVDGSPPGAILELDTETNGRPPRVSVEAVLRVAPGVGVRPYDPGDGKLHSDRIEIVVGGDVVAFEEIDPDSDADMHRLKAEVPLASSAWIAARSASGRTHTSAVYAYVDGRPILDCAVAEYWVLYLDYLRYTLDQGRAMEQAPDARRSWLAWYVPGMCTLDEVDAYVEEGRRLYASLRDYAHGPPAGAERLDRSRPSVLGPVGIVAAAPSEPDLAGRARSFAAPPNGFGELLVGRTFEEGAIGSLVPEGPLPVRSNAAGYAEVGFRLPDPGTWFLRFVWGQGALESTSEVLRLQTTSRPVEED